MCSGIATESAVTARAGQIAIDAKTPLIGVIISRAPTKNIARVA
jgi:hypothetical protein